MNEIFISELCQYIADNVPGFTFGDGNTNFKVGELVRDVNGVFAINAPSSAPDQYTPIRQTQIDFWAQNKSSVDAYNHMTLILNLLHRMHHYQTDNFEIYFSYAVGDIEDQDRNIEGCKLYRLGINFIIRNINLIS